MDEGAALAERFEEQRPRLRALAYRMLGSAAEADDAVQEAWLRLSRSGAAAGGDGGAGGGGGAVGGGEGGSGGGAGGGIENLAAWLTTVVGRVCLNMLRSRAAHREEPLEELPREPAAVREPGADPEEEAVLADSVGLAMLVVLDTLAPAERVAFVLHDMFAVPFDEIGRLTERSPAAARQLASRARRRVRGGADTAVGSAALREQRRLVDAFLAASRGGDLAGLVAVLDPDVVLHADRAAGPTPEPIRARGSRNVARGASLAAARIAFTEAALVNGAPGLVMAPLGRLRLALAFTSTAGRITSIDVIADPERLREVEIAVP
ncbi:sigma factor [Actinacidiphila epipremni]|uniref:RNA polymerase subunit sigma-70 n=1 Tax=Actinacidiphila epipremni TaxID=2053013 RepID=A0ABX0ZVS1_9ACTN|nr:sigma factor [Actinacidiphila epipremni]NJP47042.1 RNA polymerase subunit sigma-70 [Actinacidiphila epipremni]